MIRPMRQPGSSTLQKAAFEFVIIVTGVLVALAVDEWRQERADLRELNQHLALLLDEVNQNVGSTQFIRASLTQIKNVGLETVIAQLESGDPSVDDPDQFLEAFAASTLVAIPWFSYSRFEALRNSGAIRLLEPELAEAMSTAFAAPDILLPQVELLQGEYPLVAQQFVPATLQAELSPLRYYTPEATAPAIVFDITSDEAIELINENRERLLMLARGEAALVTAKWYSLKRIEEVFIELQQILETAVAERT